MEGKFGPVGVADARGQETDEDLIGDLRHLQEGAHTSCVPGPPSGGDRVVHLFAVCPRTGCALHCGHQRPVRHSHGL